MKIERVSWLIDGLRVIGEVYIPAASALPNPGLIICHGIPGKVKDPNDPGYPLLAERFCRMGFTVLIFNFRGAGLSEGNFAILGWTRDLEGALDYFNRRPEVDPLKIFLMGFSGGAAVSIYVAAQHPEIAGLVSCAAPADFKDLSTEEGAQNFLAYAREVGIIKNEKFPSSLKEWQEGFRIVKPLEKVTKIPPRPLLIIHGTEDDVVEMVSARDLYARVQGKAELFIIEGAGHRLRLEEKAIAKAQEWLKKVAFRENDTLGSI